MLDVQTGDILIAVSGEEEARSFYQSLTGYLLKQGTTSDTWHCDGLGDLTYTWKGQSDCYATVDISINLFISLSFY